MVSATLLHPPPRGGLPAQAPERFTIESPSFAEAFPDLPDADLVFDPPTPDPSDLAPPWRPFPTRLLPPSIRDFIDTAAQSFGCDAAMVAAPLLSVLAASIGNARVFHAGPDWTEPPILWTAVVSASGQKKSPSLDAALSFFNAIDKTNYETYVRETTRYEADLERYESAKKSRKPDPDAPAVKPDKPVCPTLLVGDATAEALAERLEENPRGVLSAHDELAAVFKNFDAYRGGRGGDAERMLSFYGARPLRIDRKTAIRKTIRVERASVSFTGGIQPGILRKILAKNDGELLDNGMAARFLMAFPPEPPLMLDENRIDPKAREGVAAIVGALLSLTRPPLPGFAPPPPEAVGLDPNAKLVFRAFRGLIGRTIRAVDLEDPLRAVGPKIEGVAVRLAGVLHLVRCVDPANTKPADPRFIDEAAMLVGVAVARWFWDEARRIRQYFRHSERANDDPNDGRAAVSAFLTASGGHVRVREIHRKFGGRYKWTCADMARTWLAEHLQADGLAAFERIGKSDWLVAVDAPPPPKDDDNDD